MTPNEPVFLKQHAVECRLNRGIFILDTARYVSTDATGRLTLECVTLTGGHTLLEFSPFELRDSGADE
jgi:hypothetical protein